MGRRRGWVGEHGHEHWRIFGVARCRTGCEVCGRNHELRIQEKRQDLNFIDLGEQFRRYSEEILDEIRKVLDSGQFVMGPAVEELERTLATHTGVNHAIACSSGTDALMLGMLALEVRPGDEIIVPDFTFFATAEVVAFIGATPVFVDVDEETLNMDVAGAAKCIGPRTKGIIPVSLFGQCADLDRLNALADDHGLWVMEDAAQSYGARYRGRRSGSLTTLAATSFYPAKPLGCYGDGGAVFTNDGEIALKIRELLNHGQSAPYKHSRIGINGRLDAIQASVLNVKLRHFEEEMSRKNRIAEMYQTRLDPYLRIPRIAAYNESVWAQYTVRSPSRDVIISDLKAQGIPTAVHYPIPLHRQEAFASMGLSDDSFPVSLKACDEVVSLPMHPFLTEKDVDRICTAILEALE
jgi:UDP-2-acetamido-2-deoxy-ribo-hexuluronate aminotransferase